MKHPTSGATKAWWVVVLLACGHGLGDFNAGVLLAGLSGRTGADAVLLYLLYNALAFAGQPLAGLLIDRVWHRIGWFSFGGVLSAVALPVAWWCPELGVTLAGMASAFYHAAGGAEAWERGGRSSRATGLFAAPGVLGLVVGMWSGARLTAGETLISGGVLLGSVACLLIMTRESRNVSGPALANVRGTIGFFASWLVLAAISARSFAWSAGQESFFPADFAVGMALAAATGKAGAGFLADRFGRWSVVLGSLVIAVGFFAWSGRSLWGWFAAVAALQASTGPMMAMVLEAWPRWPALASGMAQGLAIALGGLPLLFSGHGGVYRVWLATGALGVAGVLIAVAAARFVHSVPLSRP